LTGRQSARNEIPSWLPPHLLLLMKAPAPVHAVAVVTPLAKVKL
jgi:hypothetical protein